MKTWMKYTLCMILMTFILVGCGKKDVDEAQSEQSIEEIERIASELMEVETKYGNLLYPQQWKEYLKIEQEEQGESLCVKFRALINETEYTLFDIVIGEEDSESIGTIQDSDGESHNVYVHIEDNMELDNLSEEEQNRLFAMKEGVNELIAHLTK